MPELDPELVRLVARLGDVMGEATVPVTLAREVQVSVAGVRAGWSSEVGASTSRSPGPAG